MDRARRRELDLLSQHARPFRMIPEFVEDLARVDVDGVNFIADRMGEPGRQVDPGIPPTPLSRP